MRPPLLRAASHAAVLLWLAAYLAWNGGAASVAPDPSQPTARVAPVPEPPPPVASTPAPAAPEPQAQQLAVVGRAELEAGTQLLDGDGEFPVLSCSYDDFPSFRSYARAMLGLGARFVVVRDRAIVAAVNLESGAIEETPRLEGFSPRARDYTGEPDLELVARSVRERFGWQAVVMMLVPRELDAGLFGGIARALAARDDRHDEYSEIRGRYERSARGGVRLRVDSGLRMDGSEVPIGLLFDLGAISRAGGGSESAA